MGQGHISKLAAALEQWSEWRDASASGAASAALDRIDDLAQAIETQPGARLPGARRHSLRRETAVTGIQIDDDLMTQIHAASETVTE
ncbi:hypothetical protein [Paracoccus lutimaris]|uniref:hypothetical protein n=1 Tax=Paracoccus lutimaris TaxID=1490030 RepID=UPI001C694CDD|nr:hypothetical protein [Paracoccus lutimaris]